MCLESLPSCPVPYGRQGAARLCREQSPKDSSVDQALLTQSRGSQKEYNLLRESMEPEAGAKLSSHGSFQPEGYSYQI